LSAGGAFAWYREQLARDVAGSPNANEMLNHEAALIPRGAEGVTFLPYLQGERTPHRNANARGALLGLTLAHSRAHVTRAVLEGICFALRDSLSILQSLGISPNEVLLTGGGATSDFLRQLQAEIFGLPVITASFKGGPAYGAALLAAVGVGAFPDLATAARVTLRRYPSASLSPTADAHREYDEPYARFRASYRA
jgi:xylulokinase